MTLSYSTYFMSLCSSKIPLNWVYGHTLFILIRDLPIIGIIWEFLGLLWLLSFIHLHNLVYSASCLVLDPIAPDWTLCPPPPPCILYFSFHSLPGQLLLFFFKTQLKHFITEGIFLSFNKSILVAYYIPVNVKALEIQSKMLIYLNSAANIPQTALYSRWHAIWMNSMRARMPFYVAFH